MPAALIFDFDGLILDTETPLIDAWDRVHQEHGLTFDRASGHQIIGHSGVAYDPWAAFTPSFNRQILETRFETVKDEIIIHQPILPGVEDLLATATVRGIPLGVASNSFHNHVDGHLARLGLSHFFKTVTCRDDVTNPKPEPDVYLEACHRLGVDPTACIAFEDSGPGHAAAAAAGITVVVVPNPSTRHDHFPHAERVLTSLAEFDLPTPT